ncbi:MAG: helix-turn-helix transcriptional regulator [Nitrospinota bacterium]|nr:helix-turn-helix transcriptional regulator [Nitrospinota bacterium]MEE3252726.1 helix-turn-helix transcriptional regulator [Nitrospinota bacterium]
MTILSNNLKVIRKNLNCTQTSLAEVLEIGFRTYVRYEAGERDAPISILIKLARLGNISLDRLLTTKVFPEDLKIPDQNNFPNSKAPLEIIGGGLEEGRLMFKGLLNDHLISTNKEEQKLLKFFREMSPTNRKKFLQDTEWAFTNTHKSVRYRQPKKISRKEEKAKTAIKLRNLAKSINKITVRG